MINTLTNHDLKVNTLKGWIEQLHKAKVIAVVGKTRNKNVTVRTSTKAA